MSHGPLSLAAAISLISIAALASNAEPVVLRHGKDGTLTQQLPELTEGALVRIQVTGANPFRLILFDGQGNMANLIDEHAPDNKLTPPSSKDVPNAMPPTQYVEFTVTRDLLDQGSFLHYAIATTSAPQLQPDVQQELALSQTDLARANQEVADALEDCAFFPDLPPMTPPARPAYLTEDYAEALAAYLKTSHLAIDEAAARLDTMKGTSVAASAECLVRAANAVSDFRVRASAALTRFERSAKEVSKQFCGRNSPCTLYNLFSGELPIGDRRRSVVVGLDGSLLAGSATDSLPRFEEGETIFFYAIHDGLSALSLSLQVALTPITKPNNIAPIGLTSENLLESRGKPVVSIDKHPVFNRKVGKSLQRVNQGDRFSGNNIAQLTLRQKADPADAASKDRDLGSVNLRVLRTYHLALTTGVVYTSIQRATIQTQASQTVTSVVTTATDGNTTTTQTTTADPAFEVRTDPRLMPVLGVTWYSNGRSYDDSFHLSLCDALAPHPTIGFRIDSPGSDFIAGFSIEPVRGLLVSGGLTLGEQAATNGTFNAGALNTYNVWKAGWYGGVLFDLNLFGSQLLALAGF